MAYIIHTLRTYTQTYYENGSSTEVYVCKIVNAAALFMDCLFISINFY